jgi:hypothetical protein
MFRLFLAKVIFRLSLYKIFVLLDVFRKVLGSFCEKHQVQLITNLFY